jgi:hypothetical protein
MMRAYESGVLAIVVALLVPGAAAGQEKGQTGVSIEYPATVGVIYHVSDRFAIKPDISVTNTSGDTSSTGSAGGFPATFTSTRDAWEVGFGVSALFYVGKWDALRTYVSPKFAYARGTSSTAFSSGSSPGNSSAINDSTYGAAGSFGVQYTLGKRFSILGEAGLGYTRLKLSDDVADQTISTTNTVGSRARVGVIFYF